MTELFQGLSGELATLAEAADALHDAVCADAAATLHDPRVFRAVQSIDHIQQTLRNLAEFMVALADEEPGARQVELSAALSVVTLSDLRRRLLAEPAGDPPAEAGEAEFFG